MFFRDFQELSSHYQEGMKKIKYRNTWVKIQQDDLELKLTQARGNYDLYFNEAGYLYQCVHFDEYKNSRIKYNYDRFNRLVSAIEVSPLNNEFREIYELTYDDQGRLATETCRTFQSEDEPMKSFYYIHKYIDNMDIISAFINDEDEAAYEMRHTYDKNHNLIEMKGFFRNHEMEGWSKFKYDKQGNLIKQMHLDDRGRTFKTLNFRPPFLKGTGSPFTCVTPKQTYTIDNKYSFNEKGHWIQKIFLNNNEMTTFCTRDIEYYWALLTLLNIQIQSL